MKSERFHQFTLRFLGLSLAATGTAMLPPILRHTLSAYVYIDKSTIIAALYITAIAALSCGIVLFFNAARISRKIHQCNRADLKFACLTLSLVAIIGIFFLEIGARATLTPRQTLTGRDWWIQWHIDYARDHQTEDKAFLPRWEGMGEYNPKLGWILKPGYRDELLTVNQQGIRGDSPVPESKPLGEKRVLFLGDSFMLGLEVKDNEAAAHVLEDMLDGVRTINLSTPGYGTDQQYLTLKERGLKFNPDLVVIGANALSADRNLIPFQEQAKPFFELNNEELVLKNVPVPNYSLDELREQITAPPSYLCRLGSKCITELCENAPNSYKWKLYTRILDNLVADMNAINVPVMIVHIPFSPSLTPDPAESVLHNWADDKNVTFLAFREVYSTLTDAQRKEVYKYHLSPFGNRILAEAILTEIMKNSLLPCVGETSLASSD